MEILTFDKSNQRYIIQAAQLLVDCFSQAYSDCAVEEITHILEER